MSFLNRSTDKRTPLIDASCSKRRCWSRPDTALSDTVASPAVHCNRLCPSGLRPFSSESAQLCPRKSSNMATMHSSPSKDTPVWAPLSCRAMLSTLRPSDSSRSSAQVELISLDTAGLHAADFSAHEKEKETIIQWPSCVIKFSQLLLETSIDIPLRM